LSAPIAARHVDAASEEAYDERYAATLYVMILPPPPPTPASLITPLPIDYIDYHFAADDINVPLFVYMQIPPRRRYASLPPYAAYALLRERELCQMLAMPPRAIPASYYAATPPLPLMPPLFATCAAAAGRFV